ncbi:hypothetical protein VN97_g7060 [Penicillium thymicola]|uniref:Uncharacterized protein n=1 Tax=Penicillium thymicola TaxID=293382 RepID=A0AAI9TFA0_PENTH|nr:hypothetical protein VN97_g7060 [Penicillium thymicola]
MGFSGYITLDLLVSIDYDSSSAFSLLWLPPSTTSSSAKPPAYTNSLSSNNHPIPQTRTSTMVKPLTFKGDKPKKRKTRTTDNEAPTSKSRRTEPEPEDNPEDQSWVSADSPSDIAGPVVLVLPSDDPTCVASDANGQVFASKLENLVDGDPSTAEPHDVRQVWVASRVAGTESFSFKGHHGK